MILLIIINILFKFPWSALNASKFEKRVFVVKIAFKSNYIATFRCFHSSYTTAVNRRILASSLRFIQASFRSIASISFDADVTCFCLHSYYIDMLSFLFCVYCVYSLNCIPIIDQYKWHLSRINGRKETILPSRLPI